MLKIIFLVVLFISDSAGIVYAVPTESQFQTLEKLLTISSAARRIDKSDNAEAKLKHASAVTMLTKAKTAAREGNAAQADALLTEATRMMFVASRMIEKDSSSIKKDLREFDTRMTSIDALCDAYHNIRREKGLGDPESSELYPFVQKRLTYAKELKQQHRLKEGRKVLDEAYVAAKVAIEHLRGGETLVRSLNFESAEEEYHYEIDRNDTHSMLVKVLLKDKVDADDNVKKMVDKFMGKARNLRLKADQQAGGGEYEAAIITLEQSTKEIVRAIRSAGIYIPG